MTDDRRKLAFQDRQDEMAREFAESVNCKYPEPTPKRHVAAVTCPDSPDNVRMVELGESYIFVDEKKPEVVVRY